MKKSRCMCFFLILFLIAGITFTIVPSRIIAQSDITTYDIDSYIINTDNLTVDNTDDSIFSIQNPYEISTENLTFDTAGENVFSLQPNWYVTNVTKIGTQNTVYVEINNTIHLEAEEISNYKMIELPDNKIAVRNPDETIGVYNLDKNVDVKIGGSYHIKNSSVVVSAEKLDNLVYEVDNAMINLSVSQNILKLDEYKITTSFEEIYYNPDLEVFIQEYEVDWGDGTVTTEKLDPSSLTHVYKKSGSYEVTFSVDDLDYSKRIFFNVSDPDLIQMPGLIIKTYPEETAAATSAGIGTATILGFVATETGKYKLLTLLSLAIPLHTRVQKQDVLDQFVRGQIYAVIKTNPGVHYNKIMDKIDVKNGTLSYHLHMLEKTGMIKSRREGLRYRAFYTTNMTFPKEERYRLTELQIKILETIKSNEGLNQREIAEILDEKPQTISYNIKVLQQADLVSLVKKGRKTRCYLGENYQDYKNESP